MAWIPLLAGVVLLSFAGILWLLTNMDEGSRASGEPSADAQPGLTEDAGGSPGNGSDGSDGNNGNTIIPGAILQINMTTEEALRQFASYHALVHEEEGAWYVIMTDQPVTEFAFIKVGAYFGGDTVSFYLDWVEWPMGELTPEKPFAIKTYAHYGTLPHYGVAFADGDGTKRYFYMQESGYDGSPLLVEFDHAPPQPIPTELLGIWAYAHSTRGDDKRPFADEDFMYSWPLIEIVEEVEVMATFEGMQLIGNIRAVFSGDVHVGTLHEESQHSFSLFNMIARRIHPDGRVAVDYLYGSDDLLYDADSDMLRYSLSGAETHHHFARIPPTLGAPTAIDRLFQPKMVEVYQEGFPYCVLVYPYGEIAEQVGMASYVIFLQEWDGLGVEQRDNALRTHGFELTQVLNVTVDEMVDAIRRDSDYRHFQEGDSPTADFPYATFWAVDGQSWNSIATILFIRDNLRGGVFYITLRHTLEEGDGAARWWQALERLTLIE